MNTIFSKLSFALLLFSHAISAKQLEVYTEILPPFQIMASEQLVGSATEQVEQILRDAQLNYHINIVPWARAYNIVKSTPNTLIYSMNRTPEREAAFYWVKVVGQIGNSFISLRNNTLNLSSLTEAKNHVTAVVRDGYAYNLLVDQGFIADKNMYVVATLEQQISILLSGKIDFIFTDMQSVQYALKLQHLDPALVRVSFTQADWNHDLYLAANVNSDPEVLQKIAKVSSAQLR